MSAYVRSARIQSKPIGFKFNIVEKKHPQISISASLLPKKRTFLTLAWTRFHLNVRVFVFVTLKGQIYELIFSSNMIWLVRSRQAGRAHSSGTWWMCPSPFPPNALRLSLNRLSDTDQTRPSAYTHKHFHLDLGSQLYVREWQREEKHIPISP